jgi:type IV secretory pathway VirB9-like protein
LTGTRGKGMTIKKAIAALALLLAAAPFALAQSLIKTAALGPDQIGLVKSALGITTRISFSETVKEVICGDLYDPTSGKGAFVVQRSENDVFLKPVAGKALSNLFVRTGENGERVYSFDLTVVPVEQAYRVFFVKPATGFSTQGQANSGDATKALSQAERQATEIIRAAREQAAQITAQAEQRALEINRRAAEQAEREVEHRFSRALILGLREMKIGNVRPIAKGAVAKGAVITLDPRAYAFDGKTYLRYTIQNKGSDEMVFSALSLESGSGANKKSIAIEVTQSRSDNRIKPGQTISGALAFDQREAPQLDKLTLYLMGEENAEIARVVISQ